VSSREDHGRYRGRRRAPTPPRSRYAAVVTSAFLGAGVVALGTAAAFPGNATDPAALTAASANGSVTSTDLSDRQASLDRATRGDNRTDATNAAATLDQVAPDVWLLPLKNYTVTSPFGLRWGTLHPGVDLAISEGTPYVAVHSGTVILARAEGGYGFAIEIDCGDGTTVVYGHSSVLLVHEGQKVEAGQVIGLTGNTGYTTGPHLHLEIRQNGQAVNPVPYLLGKGVDINAKTDALTG
jgi:murein DD-endopeptidase MepM/ murein hydrolase activator NlpD